MRLQRIQVPCFRVLKDVDITFEKDFTPNIFPLGSQNGGGKSTLLQLIFSLLHCSTNPERIKYLKNLLKDFQINGDEEKRVLAIFDIWDGDKTVQLEFFAYQDNYIQRLLKIPQELVEDNNYLKFTASSKVKEVKSKINDLEEKITKIEKILNRLESLIVLEDPEERRFSFRDVRDLLEEVGFKYSTSVIRSRISVDFIKDIQEEVQKRLEIYKINLETFNEERENFENIQEYVLNYLESQNLLYICSFFSKASNAEKDEEALLCHFNNIDIEKIDSFLQELSNTAYLAAPSTQVFHFLPKESNKLLFQALDGNQHYQLNLQTAKLSLKGLFTYDFFANDTLIEYVKSVRDKDFQQALDAGEYGDGYKSLMNELNLLLHNKRISLEKDLSGVIFKSSINNENTTLYPEDLSHGELKRLSIYMWLKFNNIKNSIVLMDEIEIAFHPDWQYQIIQDLYQWEPSNQYILATHSYELCQALTPAHVKELEPKLIC